MTELRVRNIRSKLQHLMLKSLGRQTPVHLVMHRRQLQARVSQGINLRFQSSLLSMRYLYINAQIM